MWGILITGGRGVCAKKVCAFSGSKKRREDYNKYNELDLFFYCTEQKQEIRWTELITNACSYMKVLACACGHWKGQCHLKEGTPEATSENEDDWYSTVNGWPVHLESSYWINKIGANRIVFSHWVLQVTKIEGLQNRAWKKKKKNLNSSLPSGQKLLSKFTFLKQLQASHGSFIFYCGK